MPGKTARFPNITLVNNFKKYEKGYKYDLKPLTKISPVGFTVDLPSPVLPNRLHLRKFM